MPDTDSNNIDIRVNFLIDEAGLQKFKSINQVLKQTQIETQKAINPIKSFTKQYDFLESSQQNAAQAGKEFNSIVQGGVKQLKGFEAQEKLATKEARRFKAEYLSLLFFSFAIQRVTKSIQDAGISTFRSITESTYGATTNLLALSAGFEFLKFTIGDAINTALGPFLPYILDIIEAFAGWIQQNPELTAGILLAVSALASFGAILSIVTLGKAGIVTILTQMGTKGGTTGGTGLIGSFGSLASSISIANPELILLIAVLAITVFAIAEADKWMKTFRKDIDDATLSYQNFSKTLVPLTNKQRETLVNTLPGYGGLTTTSTQEDISAAAKKTLGPVANENRTGVLIADANGNVMLVPKEFAGGVLPLPVQRDITGGIITNPRYPDSNYNSQQPSVTINNTFDLTGAFISSREELNRMIAEETSRVQQQISNYVTSPNP